MILFKCTVIKGKFTSPNQFNPNTFVVLKVDGFEITRTKYVYNTNKPRWNETFHLSIFSENSVEFLLYKAVDNENNVLLAQHCIAVVEVVQILSRFNFGLMRTARFVMNNVDPLYDQVKFKLYLGFQKISRRDTGYSIIYFKTAILERNLNFYDLFSGDRGQTHSSRSDAERSDDLLNEINSNALLSRLEYVVLQENNNELPYGWERRQTNGGRDFYVDHNTQTTQWDRPCVLPSGWEARLLTDSSRVYYYNRHENTTSFQRPTTENYEQYRASIDEWNRRRISNRENFQDRYLFEQSDFVNPTLNLSDDAHLQVLVSKLLGPLPENYEMRIDDKSKRTFYVDHHTKTCHWLDPRLNWLSSEINPLPAGWDLRSNSFGIPYFIDHNKKTTTFYDPRTGLPSFPSAVVAMKYKLHFRDKMLYFRSLCKELTKDGVVKVAISRDHLIEESFSAIMAYSPVKLHRHFIVKFEHEEGLDYGGLTREWLYEVSHEIVNPQYCLFTNRGCSCDYLYEINPLSSIVPNHLKYFVFIGRVIGIALFHAKFLDVCFSKVFYKKILNQPCILEDLQQMDVDFYNSLKWMTKNSIEEAELDLYFCVEVENFGELKVIELKENGSDEKVTDENKEEYIRLLTDWKLNYGKSEQMEHILLGITQIVPLTWLRNFTAKELEMILCGIQNYDTNDWKSNTRYKGGYSCKSQQIVWFWDFVTSSDSETKGKLLHFVTGTTKIPATGFKDLFGSTGPQKFCIEKWGTVNDLPRSHTCFNRLDLPPYTSSKELKKKLLYSIYEGGGFFQE